jgi:tetrapyrrole methylase family protein / MazG family protein
VAGGGRPLVEVVGLGPGGPDLVTAGTLEVFDSVPPAARFLRTTRHPAAVVGGASTSFDHRYEAGSTLDEVYASIVEDLVGAAGRTGRVVYAVPGSPVVAERTVELLLADPRVEVVVHPALSFLDLTWVRLGVDPVATAVRVVDGHRFAIEAAGERGPLLVAQCDSAFVLSDVKLAVEDLPDEPVTVLQRLGLADESVRRVAWEDLDRDVEPDHLTSLWIPRLAAPVASEVTRFAELMTELRSEDPWKASQTHDSLKRYLLEESYEVLEAVDAYDPVSGEGADELCGELGDLLYQVVFHAAIGAEAGWFTLADVARSIHDKLVARHPHLGSGDTPEVEDLVAAWEHAKRDEHGRASAFDGIPVALPALARALKVGRKAEALGLLDGVAPDLAALVGGLDPARADAVGDLFVAVAEVARRHDVDPEDAARRALGRAEARYRDLEARPDRDRR